MAQNQRNNFMAEAVKLVDPNTRVGACIVNQDNKIVGVGYNCMLDGCDNPANEDLYVCHAELNAFINARNSGVKGCTMYVTLFPCNECAKLIIQAGLNKVVYLSDEDPTKVETIASKRMLGLAGIPYTRFVPTTDNPLTANDTPASAHA